MPNLLTFNVTSIQIITKIHGIMIVSQQKLNFRRLRHWPPLGCWTKIKLSS